MLRDLVFAFDCEDGLPESVFEATADLILTMLGEKSADHFRNCIDATESRFYLKRNSAPGIWSGMCELAKK
jgi:hypothetical protein